MGAWRSPAAGAARVRVGDDLRDRGVGEGVGARVAAAARLRARLELPGHARAQAGDRFLLGEAEPVERTRAVGKLGRGDVGTQLRAILLGGRALHPFETHAASILVEVRQLSIAGAIAM